MARLANDATPFTAATSTMPWSFAAGFGVAPSRSDTTSFAGSARLPYWSWIATCTAGEIVSPARACVGSVRNASRAGAPATLVAGNVLGGNAPAVAVTIFVPTTLPSIQLPALATPRASLVSLVAPRAPPPVAAKSTMTPATPLPNWSATFTTGAVTAVPTVPVCGSADCLTSCVAAPASAVAVKVTGEPARPLTDAVAVCVPTAGPSVCVELAIPFTSVRDVAGFINPPPRPAAQWTGTPWTGRPTAFLTATESAGASAGPTTPDCPFPALRTMLVAVVTIPVALNVIGLPARPGTAASSVLRPGASASVQLVTRATP